MSLSVSALLKLAGASPAFQAVSIIGGTFILEDAATVLAAMQVQDGRIWWPVALGSLYVGIVLGDAGLYGLGRLAATWPPARRWLPPEGHENGRRWIEKRVFRVVFVSRFIPGARLPSYTSCGYFRADFRRFVLAAVLATSIWTSMLFVVSLHVGRFLMDHLGAWRWLGWLVFAAFIVLLGRMAARLRGAQT